MRPEKLVLAFEQCVFDAAGFRSCLWRNSSISLERSCVEIDVSHRSKCGIHTKLTAAVQEPTCPSPPSEDKKEALGSPAFSDADAALDFRRDSRLEPRSASAFSSSFAFFMWPSESA